MASSSEAWTKKQEKSKFVKQKASRFVACTFRNMHQIAIANHAANRPIDEAAAQKPSPNSRNPSPSPGLQRRSSSLPLQTPKRPMFASTNDMISSSTPNEKTHFRSSRSRSKSRSRSWFGSCVDVMSIKCNTLRHTDFQVLREKANGDHETYHLVHETKAHLLPFNGYQAETDFK